MSDMTMLRQSCERRLVAALRLVVLTTVDKKYPESDGGIGLSEVIASIFLSLVQTYQPPRGVPDAA